MLVNNAAIDFLGTIEEQDTLFEVNFFGAVALLRLVLPGSRTTWGDAQFSSWRPFSTSCRWASLSAPTESLRWSLPAFNPSVGVYTLWDDAFFKGHPPRFRASTWGSD